MNNSQGEARSFVEWLESHRQERGIMADLRNGFAADRAYRAWPHIARWCGKHFTDDHQRLIHTIVAAAFATHPQTGGVGGMGATMRRIAVGQDKSKGIESYEGRLRRLLACETVEEICERLGGVVRVAKQRGFPLDHTQLFRDLQGFRWPEARKRVKVRWASEYWTAPADTLREDE